MTNISLEDWLHAELDRLRIEQGIHYPMSAGTNSRFRLVRWLAGVLGERDRRNTELRAKLEDLHAKYVELERQHWELIQRLGVADETIEVLSEE